MAKTIYESVQAPIIATYWNEKLSERAPFVGETLFPDKKQLGLKLSWIKGAFGSQASLKLSAFDAKAIRRDRIGFEEVSEKMPFFKEAMAINEEDRQKLNEVLASGNQAKIDIITNKIYDDTTTLLGLARVSRERMRMQALTTGLISLASNGQELTVDYGVPVGQKTQVGVSWSNIAATIISDINTALDVVEDVTGNRPTRALCGRTVFANILKNTEIKNAMSVFTGGKAILTESIAKSYILEMTGLEIAIYTKKYMNEAGTMVNYIPNDVFVMFPVGDLGNTYFGTTPEESDLLNSPIANVSIVDTGVAVTTTNKVDPVNVDTKVSMICLPSFEKANEIYILDTAI